MIILFYLTSLVILLSTIGYGFLLVKISKVNEIDINYGLIGFFGLFLLSIILSYDHLIISHNYIHNIIIILTGLIFFFKFNFDKKEFKKILTIFSIFFIALLIAKTNEDYPYYHLPNSLQFAQQKLQFGIGNLNHGFKHISSLFMLMSLNYIPLFEHYLFNLTNYLFLVFLIHFIINKIFYKSLNINNFSLIFLSFILMLFLIKFNRLAEYGADIAGQILIVLYIYYCIEVLFNKTLKLKNQILFLKISLIFLVFAITTKFILSIYFIIFLCTFILFKKKKDLFVKLVSLKYLILLILPFSIFLFFNFSSTGCILYPVSQTCFDNKFEWSIPRETIYQLNVHYELWSKGGAGPGFKVNNPSEYLQSLNWIPHWIDNYFFNKFSDFILTSILISLIIIFFNVKQMRDNRKFLKFENKKLFKYLYLSCFFIFLLWFFNFPSLRYAGYLIVYLIIVLPIVNLISIKVDLKKKQNLKTFSSIFIICLTIFYAKNLIRINNSLNISHESHHNFKNFPFYWVEKVNYEEKILFNHKVYLVNSRCWNTPSTCVRFVDSLIIKNKKNYIFYSLK